ncbi:uncharacterized protein LOC131951717 [Physella acuta]|uniref:uncharacterized protein LOC131951717 n=1 Tax=Physella acuta TaxID=109671 RepID=UPI0027DAC003|nr:uncharacterized protein LOC131951717 [Physella acuta]
MATMKVKEKRRLNKMAGGGQGVSDDVRMLMESGKNVSNNSHSQNEAELSSEERKRNIEATQRPMEENVIQRPMEENVIQRPMEQNDLQRPMEQDVGITQKPIHIKENITQKPIHIKENIYPEQELALTCPQKAQDTLMEPPTQPHTPSHPQHVTDININQSKGGPSSHEAKTPSIDRKYHQLVHQPNAHLATAAPTTPQQGAYLHGKSPTRASETNRHFPEGELVGGGRDDKGNRSRASISNHIGGAKSCPGVGAAGVSRELSELGENVTQSDDTSDFDDPDHTTVTGSSSEWWGGSQVTSDGSRDAVNTAIPAQDCQLKTDAKILDEQDTPKLQMEPLYSGHLAGSQEVAEVLEQKKAADSAWKCCQNNLTSKKNHVTFKTGSRFAASSEFDIGNFFWRDKNPEEFDLPRYKQKLDKPPIFSRFFNAKPEHEVSAESPSPENIELIEVEVEPQPQIEAGETRKMNPPRRGRSRNSWSTAESVIELVSASMNTSFDPAIQRPSSAKLNSRTSSARLNSRTSSARQTNKEGSTNELISCSLQINSSVFSKRSDVKIIDKTLPSDTGKDQIIHNETSRSRSSKLLKINEEESKSKLTCVTESNDSFLQENCDQTHFKNGVQTLTTPEAYKLEDSKHKQMRSDSRNDSVLWNKSRKSTNSASSMSKVMMRSESAQISRFSLADDRQQREINWPINDREKLSPDAPAAMKNQDRFPSLGTEGQGEAGRDNTSTKMSTEVFFQSKSVQNSFCETVKSKTSFRPPCENISEEGTLPVGEFRSVSMGDDTIRASLTSMSNGPQRSQPGSRASRLSQAPPPSVQPPIVTDQRIARPLRFQTNKLPQTKSSSDKTSYSTGSRSKHKTSYPTGTTSLQNMASVCVQCSSGELKTSFSDPVVSVDKMQSDGVQCHLEPLSSISFLTPLDMKLYTASGTYSDKESSYHSDTCGQMKDNSTSGRSGVLQVKTLEPARTLSIQCQSQDFVSSSIVTVDASSQDKVPELGRTLSVQCQSQDFIPSYSLRATRTSLHSDDAQDETSPWSTCGQFTAIGQRSTLTTLPPQKEILLNNLSIQCSSADFPSDLAVLTGDCIPETTSTNLETNLYQLSEKTSEKVANLLSETTGYTLKSTNAESESTSALPYVNETTTQTSFYRSTTTTTAHARESALVSLSNTTNQSTKMEEKYIKGTSGSDFTAEKEKTKTQTSEYKSTNEKLKLQSSLKSVKSHSQMEELKSNLTTEAHELPCNDTKLISTSLTEQHGSKTSIIKSTDADRKTTNAENDTDTSVKKDDLFKLPERTHIPLSVDTSVKESLATTRETAADKILPVPLPGVHTSLFEISDTADRRVHLSQLEPRLSLPAIGAARSSEEGRDLSSRAPQLNLPALTGVRPVDSHLNPKELTPIPGDPNSEDQRERLRQLRLAFFCNRKQETAEQADDNAAVPSSTESDNGSSQTKTPRTSMKKKQRHVKSKMFKTGHKFANLTNVPEDDIISTTQAPVVSNFAVEDDQGFGLRRSWVSEKTDPSSVHDTLATFDDTFVKVKHGDEDGNDTSTGNFNQRRDVKEIHSDDVCNTLDDVEAISSVNDQMEAVKSVNKIFELLGSAEIRTESTCSAWEGTIQEPLVQKTEGLKADVKIHVLEQKSGARGSGEGGDAFSVGGLPCLEKPFPGNWIVPLTETTVCQVAQGGEGMGGDDMGEEEKYEEKGGEEEEKGGEEKDEEERVEEEKDEDEKRDDNEVETIPLPRPSHPEDEFERTLEDYNRLSNEYPNPDDNTWKADDEPKKGGEQIEADDSLIFTAPTGPSINVTDEKEDEELVRSKSNILRVSQAFEQLLMLTLGEDDQTNDGRKSGAAKSEGVKKGRKREPSDSVDMPSEAETETRAGGDKFRKATKRKNSRGFQSPNGDDKGGNQTKLVKKQKERGTILPPRVLAESFYYPHSNTINVVVKPINVQMDKDNINVKVQVHRPPSRLPLLKKAESEKTAGKTSTLSVRKTSAQQKWKRSIPTVIPPLKPDKNIIESRASNPPFNLATTPEADERYHRQMRYRRVQ